MTSEKETLLNMTGKSINCTVEEDIMTSKESEWEVLEDEGNRKSMI